MIVYLIWQLESRSYERKESVDGNIPTADTEIVIKIWNTPSLSNMGLLYYGFKIARKFVDKMTPRSGACDLDESCPKSSMVNVSDCIEFFF